MFFALLLVNVFIAKDLHYITEFSHDHDHDHGLVDRHSNCTGDAHFHGYAYQSGCNICDFNFSPRDYAAVKKLNIEPPLFSSAVLTYQRHFCFKINGSPPSLRGPPILFS